MLYPWRKIIIFFNKGGGGRKSSDRYGVEQFDLGEAVLSESINQIQSLKITVFLPLPSPCLLFLWFLLCVRLLLVICNRTQNKS